MKTRATVCERARKNEGWNDSDSYFMFVYLFQKMQRLRKQDPE